MKENKSSNNENEFILPIFNKKKKFDIKSYILLRKTIKKIKKISPDFDTMYNIWDMVNTLHICYMHSHNDGTNLHLFLGTIPKGYSADNTFSMIYVEDGLFSIKFILQLTEHSKNINIEIVRSNKTNAVPERIRFEDGTYEFKDYRDEEKFGFITACLMNGLTELLEYYYKNKKF